MATGVSAARVTYREVLAVREFRAIFLSQGLSTIGDQITRIAVALLVFDRTGSAFAASATYACSFLTWLVGGPVLSVLADRYPRLGVMVMSDLARAALVAALVVPGLGLVPIFVLLLLIGALAPPFDASRSSLLPEILKGERYVVGNVLMNAVFQGGQVAGFVLGGGLVASVGYEAALLLDCSTFLLSAGTLLMFVQSRPSATAVEDRLPFLAETKAGVSAVARTPDLRGLLILSLLGTAVAIPSEGLAVAMADEIGRGPVTAGALTAAVPLGFLVGSAALVRLPAERRLGLVGRLMLLSAVPLLVMPATTSPVLLVALLVVTGVGSALQLVLSAEYVQRTPAHLRGRAYGVAGSAIMAVQAVVLLAAGGAAEAVSTRWVLAVTGAAALLLLPYVLRQASPHALSDIAAAEPQGIGRS
jgi:MFS family permease